MKKSLTCFFYSFLSFLRLYFFPIHALFKKKNPTVSLNIILATGAKADKSNYPSPFIQGVVFFSSDGFFRRVSIAKTN